MFIWAKGYFFIIPKSKWTKNLSLPCLLVTPIPADRYETYIVWSYSDEAIKLGTPAVSFTRITSDLPRSILQQIDYAEELLDIFHA